MFPTHHFWKQPRRLRFYRMVLLGLWMLAGLAAAAPVQAMIPYDTEYYEHNLKFWVYVQPIYIPHRYITGESEFGPGFTKPSDLYIAGDGRVFVADTGNNRIVVLDRQGEVVAVVGTGEGEGKLSAPEGVFVDTAGKIYVADTGNKRIAVFDAQGQFIREYVRPDSNLLPAADQYFFVPSKLVVDVRGVMYIVVKGSYQGVLRMDGNGEFTGFFGANKTPVTFLDRLKGSWMTKEQRAKEIAKRPLEVRNLALDGEGFIYTTTQAFSGQVKRLNASGTDTLKGKTFSNADMITDVAVDEDGMMYLLDAEKGKATIYTSEGQPLFTFGDRQMTALQFGVLSQPSSIAVGGDDELWIADSHLGVVEIFKKTEFGDNVMKAVKYDLIGDYEQSKPYWQAAIEQNDYLSIAYRGLGHSYYRENNNEQAIENYRISFDATGYSDAFWNIRLKWLQTNFVYLLGVLAVGLWGVVRGLRLLKRWIKRRQWSPRLAGYGSELKAAWYLLFHPYNGFYQLKDRRISFAVLALLALLAIGTRLLNVYGVGFVFNPMDRSWISLPWTLIGFVVPWFTWVIANYLVSTVKDGEGRFREVLQTSIYAMIPYVVWVPLLTLLSHFIVLEERILYDAGIRIVNIWVIIMFFVMTQVIHNFEFMETAKNAIISVITIVLIWIFVVIMGGLGYNLFDFFGQVIREVKLYG
ncbi:YIP1 family protein [Paenibacillus sp. PAMC21692]|uniref:YIP1 family protein n=1 Tax=Paenibacillus sp. PAMC21692 TaxID=2762320 RepID=UPI00164D03EE|nr:YIP1 family protein [Paenibacillus sp. PAMC21692]QNK57264.1 YIP1 family protein [Paenibacillus sp. PAMC21692]